MIFSTTHGHFLKRLLLHVIKLHINYICHFHDYFVLYMLLSDLSASMPLKVTTITSEREFGKLCQKLKQS